MISKTEAFEIMKSRRGEKTIILFHNGAYLEAYNQDATTVAEAIGITTETIEDLLTARFTEGNQAEVTNALLDAGYAVCISEMRDSNGNFIVDINQEEVYEEEQ